MDFLYEQKLILRVRGGVASGTRPYVQYKGARYRNTQVAHHGKLVGSKIIGILDRRNIALIRAFLPSGEPLGVLKAQGRWGLSPHSLKTRQAILMLERRGELPSVTADPLGSYVAKLTELAPTHRRAANELARVRRERGEIREDRVGQGAAGLPSGATTSDACTPEAPVKANDREPIGSEVSNTRGALAQTGHTRPVARETETASTPVAQYELSLGSGVVVRRRERG